MMNMGSKIYNLRTTQGMTLEELGNKVGVGKSTVRKWENGMIANMKRDKIIAVAKALNTTPSYLMGWDAEQEIEVPEEQSYYYDKEADKAAEFLFKNPDYKVLFDATRKVKKEDIEFVKQMIERLSDK